MNRLITCLALWLVGCGAAHAEPAAPGALGPYNLTILQGGIGMQRTLPPDTPIAQAGAHWTLSSWVKLERAPDTTMTVAALGDPHSSRCICLQVDAQGVGLRVDEVHTLQTQTPLPPGMWTLVVATYDGTVLRLFVQGEAAGELHVATGAVTPDLY